jgi:hypothetical protein
MPEPVLVHYHIFKNAGTSLDALLSNAFGEGWVTFEGSHGSDVQRADQLAAFLAARPAVREVSSHLARPPLPAPHCLPLIMLRHPIDRARSAFQFAQKDPVHQDHAVAKSGTFGDYVNWVMDNPGEGITIRNYQVFHLSDATFREGNALMESTSEDLAQAQALIASWPAFGLAREFAASCRLFEAVYSPLFPELRLYPLHANRSQGHAPSEDDAIDAARAELGERAFARLCEANELDMALYAFARRLFANHVRGETWPIHEFGRAVWATHNGEPVMLG